MYFSNASEIFKKHSGYFLNRLGHHLIACCIHGGWSPKMTPNNPGLDILSAVPFHAESETHINKHHVCHCAGPRARP